MSNFNFDHWENEAKRLETMEDNYRKTVLSNDFGKTLNLSPEYGALEENSLFAFVLSEEPITAEECVRVLKLTNIPEDHGLFLEQQLILKQFLKSIGYEEIANLINEHAYPHKS